MCVRVCVCKCMSQRIKQNELSVPKLPLLTIFEERIKILSWAKTYCSSSIFMCRSSFLGDLEFSVWLLSISCSPLALGDGAQAVPSLRSGLWGSLFLDGASCLGPSPFPLFSEQSPRQEEGPCSHNMRPVAAAFEFFELSSFCF